MEAAELLYANSLSGKYVQKQASLVWKLSMLLLVGLSGICMCFLGVDQRIFTGKLRQASYLQRKTNYIPCQESTDYSFPVHYLQPVSYNRQECFCTPVHRFVILSMQRSGSGWFETLLNDHPNISSHGEIFANETRRESFASIKKILDTVYNLDWHSSASKNDCTAAVGFKWMLNQGSLIIFLSELPVHASQFFVGEPYFPCMKDYVHRRERERERERELKRNLNLVCLSLQGAMEYNKEALAYFKERGVSLIFLFRHNILRRYVSILANVFDKDAKLLNGRHQSHVHSRFEAEILASFKPTVNVTFLPAYLRRIQQIIDDAFYFFNSTRHTVIYYEDIDKLEKIMGIQNFLGLKPRNLTSHHVKIHTKPLSEQVLNWQEVKGRLKGTDFESFLHD